MADAHDLIVRCPFCGAPAPPRFVEHVIDQHGDDLPLDLLERLVQTGETMRATIARLKPGGRR